MKKQIIKLRLQGKSYNEIQKILGCSKGLISYHCGDGQKEKTIIRQNKNRDRKRTGARWDIKLLNQVITLLKESKNCTEISILIKHKKSPASILKKLHRLGYKIVNYAPINIKGDRRKYKNMNWKEIQKKYDEGFNTKELGISWYAICWAKDNGLLKIRNHKESIIKYISLGRGVKSKSEGLIRYRQLCEFKFGVKNYPAYFDLSLIEKHGWYKAKNRGDNPNGVSRDHLFSISDGYKNNIDPKIISHPANCILVLHKDNQKKHSKSTITIEELKEKIKKWSDG